MVIGSIPNNNFFILSKLVPHTSRFMAKTEGKDILILKKLLHCLHKILINYFIYKLDCLRNILHYL